MPDINDRFRPMLSIRKMPQVMAAASLTAPRMAVVYSSSDCPIILNNSNNSGAYATTCQSHLDRQSEAKRTRY